MNWIDWIFGSKCCEVLTLWVQQDDTWGTSWSWTLILRGFALENELLSSFSSLFTPTKLFWSGRENSVQSPKSVHVNFRQTWQNFLCFEHSGRSNSRSAGRSLRFSKETSWGVPAGAAWSPQTRRGRPPPADQECEKTAGCSLKKIKVKVKEEGKEEAMWSSVGAAFVERLHPWITGAGCQFLLPPPHDLLELRAWTPLETPKTERRKAVEEKEAEDPERWGRREETEQRSRDKQLVRRWNTNRKWKSSEATQRLCQQATERLCWLSEDFISKQGEKISGSVGA